MGKFYIDCDGRRYQSYNEAKEYIKSLNKKKKQEEFVNTYIFNYDGMKCLSQMPINVDENGVSFGKVTKYKGRQIC